MSRCDQFGLCFFYKNEGVVHAGIFVTDLVLFLNLLSVQILNEKKISAYAEMILVNDVSDD